MKKATKKSTRSQKDLANSLASSTEDKSPERLDQSVERALLRRLANGDRVAFDEVHQRFAGLIFATVYQVLRDHQDTEDVSQEVFVSLWKKASLYQENKGEPLTWVSSLARNRAIDRLRSKERKARLRDAVQADPDRVTPAEIKDAAEQTSIKERGHIVRSAVMELTSEQRQVIELAYFSGLSQSQIADELDAPLGTIKARMRRGLGKLRGLVEDRIVPVTALMALIRLTS